MTHQTQNIWPYEIMWTEVKFLGATQCWIMQVPGGVLVRDMHKRIAFVACTRQEGEAFLHTGQNQT